MLSSSFNTEDSSLISKAHIYCKENQLELLKKILEEHHELINLCDTTGNTLLLTSIKEKHISEIQYLLGMEPDVNQANNV